jgi:hypothetical protein
MTLRVDTFTPRVQAGRHALKGSRNERDIRLESGCEGGGTSSPYSGSRDDDRKFIEFEHLA